MKAIKILLIVLAVIVAIVVGALFAVNHYIQRPGFKHKVTALASKALHTEVKLESLHVSLFSGLELRGLAIANPSGFNGDFVTVRAFVLNYRLLPLFHKRIELGTVSLEGPVVTLVKNANGTWNYDNLGAVTGKSGGGGTGEPSQPTGGSLEVPQVVIRHGSIVMLGDDGKPLLDVNDMNAKAVLGYENANLSGTGEVRVAAITAPDLLSVRDVKVPVMASQQEIRLPSLTGKIGGGDLTGSAVVNVGGALRYQASVQVTNVDLTQMFEEAQPHEPPGAAAPLLTGELKVETTDAREMLEKATQYISFGGKLQLQAAVTGGSGLESLVGTGRVEVANGTLGRLPLQELVAELLQLPELREIKFDECRVEFAVSNNVVETPVIRLMSPLVRVTGAGTVSLADYTLNHKMRLMLAKEVIARMPQEMAALFEEQTDGFYGVNFKVWGPADKPKTDLGRNLLKGGVKQLLKKLLSQ
jgi:uncharacterized protein involved in outer membrane biogenesis